MPTAGGGFEQADNAQAGVETVFGIIKHVQGFRQFLLRGLRVRQSFEKRSPAVAPQDWLQRGLPRLRFQHVCRSRPRRDRLSV